MKFVDKATGNVTNSKGYAFVDYDKHEDALCKLFLSFSVFFQYDANAKRNVSQPYLI